MVGSLAPYSRPSPLEYRFGLVDLMHSRRRIKADRCGTPSHLPELLNVVSEIAQHDLQVVESDRLIAVRQIVKGNALQGIERLRHRACDRLVLHVSLVREVVGFDGRISIHDQAFCQADRASNPAESLSSLSPKSSFDGSILEPSHGEQSENRKQRLNPHSQRTVSLNPMQPSPLASKPDGRQQEGAASCPGQRRSPVGTTELREPLDQSHLGKCASIPRLPHR